MNEQMKKQLETVINATVNEDTQAAKDAFHAYITAKTQQILLGEAAECDKDDMDDEEDEGSGKPEKSDKDDKKPAFLKKGKKEEKDEDDE